MSAYANANYGPPPMGQVNLVNGMPPAPAAAQQHVQQQQQQQQQPFAQHQYQHQQQLQQKQQQLASAMPPPSSLNTSMSKFMPPTTAAARQPATANTQTSPISNIPPHLRPPAGMNGPSGAPLTNGGGDMSGHSSRNASPSLSQQQQHFPAIGAYPQPPTQQQSHQQQLPTTMPQQQQVKPPMSMAGSGAMPLPPAKFTTPLPPSSTASLAAGMGGLSGSMQNLGISRTNGTGSLQQSQMPPTSATAAVTSSQQQLRQPPAQQQPQQYPTNFQGNFKTSPLNTSSPMPAPPTASTTAPMPMSGPYANRPLQQQPPTSSSTYNPMTARTTNPPFGPNSANVYGTSTGPPITSAAPSGQQRQLQQQNANFPPTSAAGSTMPLQHPPTAAAAMQQNQLNNNQQQQTAPPPSTRKPMYPTNAQLPSMPPPPGTQTQQPYSQAYQQQTMPPTQPGIFNGQPSSGPLQYQSQPYMQQPQQQPQQQQQYQQQSYPGGYNQQLSITQQGFNRLWGQDTIDLMQNRHILSPATLPPPRIVLHNQFQESINCHPNIMRCTMAKIPENNSLLQKSRLPLGILVHPFRDINSLPVIQCPNIVRCRLCRTYINPFVYFVDSKMWKCNLCYRVNELPDDFQYDPATKTYGDVTRRPEVRSSTIEFVAPSEYMLRPPQPAIYLFLFDVSIIAQQSGYLENACSVLNKHLDDMPGDARTQVGFIAYNSYVHFYSMADGYNQPHEMTLLDIDDPFLPRPDNLLVNLKECKELVKDLLTQLPHRYADTHDPGSAMGAALQVAYKLMHASGGRVTVFQTCLPNKGPGSLEPREDPNNRSAKDVAHLNPATDFYKRYALDCSGYQIAVDLFILNQQYSDLATISGMSRHSGGCIHHFPLYQKTKPQLVESFRQCFKRYLTRKIGFEAVMRIRCTRGLQVHTFHGNFFVRSTDLLSLPNVNPDAGYGMQISYEEALTEAKTVCFQAALLYTNSEGERRIRVHTLCLPVTSSLPEVMHAADSEAIIGLLSKMAVDRSMTSNVTDAREAFINATVDIFNAFKIAQNLPSGQSGQLIAPRSLALMPLYILALLKHPAFRVGTSTRLDDRVHAMDLMKTLPLDLLMKFIYPEFYLIDGLFYNTQNVNVNAAEDEDEDDIPPVPRLQLSAEFLDSRSIFLMDCGPLIMIYVGLNVPANILESVLGVKSTAEIPDYLYGLPNVNSPENDALKRFILKSSDDKPHPPIVQIIRDTSTAKPQFMEKLVDDRSESSLSYYEFLQHVRTQVK